MGHPKKPKKQYSKPGHPWEAERIKEEASLRREYGMTNKKEIWRATSKLRNWQKQARQIVSLQEDQRKDAENALVNKLNNLGILPKDTHIDDILALTIRDVLERRLQTCLYKLGVVNSIKQARQFILHNKVMVNDKIINAPNYLVTSSDKIALITGFKPIIKKTLILKKKEEKPAVSDEAKTDAEVVEKIATEATKEASA